VEKQVPFKKLEDFSFTLYQSLPRDEQLGKSGFKDSPILSVQTQNLTESASLLKKKFDCVNSDIKTEFSIRLSVRDGRPEILYGSVSCEVEVPVEKKGGVVDDVKEFFGFGSKKEDQEPLMPGSDSDPSSSVERISSATTSSTTETPSGSSDTKADEKQVVVTKKTEQVYLEFTTQDEGIPEVTKSQLKRIRAR
jgi:hypoxia up-regulated 1